MVSERINTWKLLNRKKKKINLTSRYSLTDRQLDTMTDQQVIGRTSLSKMTIKWFSSRYFVESRLFKN